MTTNTVPGISALQCVISSLRDTAHLSDEGGELTDQLRELRDWALSTAAQPPAAPQEELREDASYESMNLAVMVLSDCGHSSNYTPLLERVAGRIDRHVERLLTAQRADLTRRAQAAPAQPERVHGIGV